MLEAMYDLNAAAVEALLDTGRDSVPDDETDPSCFITALHIAAYINDAEICQILLARSEVDVNARTPSGDTPLHLGCLRNSMEVVDLLLRDPRVQADAVQNTGCTPLLDAVGKRHPGIVTALIISGKDLVPWRAGFVQGTGPVHTPLSLAQDRSWMEMSALLTSFEHDPCGTRHSLRLTIGDPLALAAELCALVVMLSDGFFLLTRPEMLFGVRLPMASRFLAITERLPLELQVVMSLRSQRMADDHLSSKLLELAFRHIASQT